jgi:hypothetical protein
MKVKRIGTLKTMRQYEQVLLEGLIPRYLAKSQCHDSPQRILADMRMECHNPFYLICVLLDDEGGAVGFAMAKVNILRTGRQIIVEHLYAPNMGMMSKLLEMTMSKLQSDHVMWITYRDPQAWIRFTRNQKRPAELYGWLLKFKEG